MSKGSSRRFHPWKESSSSNKCASAGSVKVMPRSGLSLDSMQMSIEKIRGLKRDGLSQLKLFVKPRNSTSKREDSSSNSTPSPEVVSTENSPEEEEDDNHTSFRKKLSDISDHEKWTLVQTRGTKPAPRYNHAAAVVGRKLLVIGGATGTASRNDVQMLHLGKLSWAKIGVGDSAPSKGLPIKTGPAQELPNCRGHSLITWGKTVILVGGLMDPPEDKISVWSFDLEMDSWTTVVTKGEVPSARRGQSVTRAGSILVMLGGEDSKGRKLNDLHILDLKSLMWLPLHPSGKGPSPRARHVAEMYDDRFLVVFGGETRSKISSDIYALDFDNMEWSKLKMKGLPLAPRAGHAGAIVGNKWYIAGGESRVPGMLDTIALDLLRMDWSVVTPAFQDSAASFQGLSLNFVERKDKKFLVAFGGYGDQATNAVQVLHIPPEEPPRMTLAGLLELPTTPDLQVQAHSQFLRPQPGPLPSFLGASIPCACVSVAKTSLGPIVDHNTSSQRSSRSSRSVSDLSMDLDRDSGLVPLRMRYAAAMQSSQKVEPLARPTRPSSQVSRADSMGRRRLSKESGWDSVTSSRRRDLALPKLKDSSSAVVEASVRQHQSAQRIRGDWQSTEITAPSSVDSGILCAKELQITAPSVHPGLLSSVGDAGTLLFQTAANLSGRGGRSHKGGSQSSEFSGYAETFVSGNGEEHSHSEPSMNNSTGSSESNVNSMPSASNGCQSEGSSSRTVSYYEEDEHHRSSNGTVSDYTEVERNRLSTGRNSEDGEDMVVAVSSSTASVVEEDELEVLAELEKADTVLERSMAISKLRETHERKLAAAIRTGELLAGQFAEALRNRDDAERTLHTVNESRQHAEGRLALALKQIKELQERLSVTELAREESNNLIHSARVEKLKLEQDLALKNAVLGESQKELQATRGVLIAEGTRAFQLQVELFDVKHQLQNLNSRALPPHAQIQQPILA
ncbi:unnamed protein product [Calypogeia fissa]